METVELSTYHCRKCACETIHTTEKIGERYRYSCTKCGNLIDKEWQDLKDSDSFRSTIELAQKREVEKPCLWCRIFGHKWHDFQTIKLCSRAYQKLIIFENCTRCGKLNPNSKEYAIMEGGI